MDMFLDEVMLIEIEPFGDALSTEKSGKNHKFRYRFSTKISIFVSTFEEKKMQNVY